MKRVLVALLATVVLAGCSDHPAATQANAQAPQPAQKVSVVPVVQQRLDATVTLPAQLSAYEAVDVYPKVTGFVESISVDRGSHVRTGEVIARLSAPELVAQRSQAEAHVQAAQAQLASARAKLASDEGTYAHLAAAAKTPGVVAGNDLAVAEQTAASDKAQVEAASNNAKAAQDALRAVTQLEEYLQVRAPFTGVVTQRNLHPGALAGPASGASVPPIVRIESSGRLRVIIPVPEQYAAGIQVGQTVRFNVTTLPGQTFTAPIARVSHDVSQNTRTMAVELDVRDAKNEIAPGSFASVEWPVRRPYETMFVPASAITTDLQRTFVIRVRDNKAEWVDVKTGASTKNATEVFGELHPGDMVVQTATDAIRPGTSVTASEVKAR